MDPTRHLVLSQLDIERPAERPCACVPHWAHTSMALLQTRVPITARAAPSRLLAVGYLRRSTDRQEQSIPDQKRAVERFAAENGLRIERHYVDDAISGTSASQRRAFQEMVADAQRPGCPFGYVVVYDVKRFGRLDNDEAGYYRHILKTHGVEVLYASENFARDGTDDLLRPVKQWQAREESKDLSKVTIRGLLSKVESGAWMGGAPPYGYDLRYETDRGAEGEFLFVLRFMPDGTKLVLDEEGQVTRTLERRETLSISKRDRAKLVPSAEERVAAVQRIFRMSAEENRGYASIAEALNGEGLPAPRGPAWARIYNGAWTSSTIRSILVNPVYAGDLVWNRRTDARFHRISQKQATPRRDVYGARLVPNPEEDWIRIPASHEPLVSRRLVELAQQVREARPTSKAQRGQNPRVVGGWRGQRARFLLSGLVQCARCGGRYEGCRRTKGNPRADGSKVLTFYYGCGSYIRRGRSACRFGPIDQDAIEAAVVETLLSFYERYRGDAGLRLLAQRVKEAVGSESEDLAQARTRVLREQEKLERTVARLLDNITPANRAFVDERLEALGKTRDALSRRLEELDALALGAQEVQGVVRECATFLASLEFSLRHDAPDARIRAARQCVSSIVFDFEKREATLATRIVPTSTLVTTAAASVRVALGDLSKPQRSRRTPSDLRHFVTDSTLPLKRVMNAPLR